MQEEKLKQFFEGKIPASELAKDIAGSVKYLDRITSAVHIKDMETEFNAWDADDDELVAEVIADWSCPEVNYPLTFENVSKFKAWLTETEPYPPKPDRRKADGRVISITEKKKL